ncbi:MAG TPA: 50S ribosomal protein L17 [Patescibacteria group bacterium]
MLKKVYGKKLSRAQGARRALFRSLIRAIVIDGKIITTYAKAKSVQADIDKIMKKVKRNDLASRKQVLATLANDKVTVNKLFTELKSVAEGRKSGFTRISALPPRKGDSAAMVRLEWSTPAQKKTEKKVKVEKEVTKKK